MSMMMTPGGEAGDLNALPARVLAEALPDPVVLIDSNGATVYANPAATAEFGMVRPGTLLQHRFRAPEMQQLLMTALSDGRAGTIDFGERVPVERAFRVSVTPLSGASGMLLVHFKDQSETRRIDRMRADFIANASHELRTPLASISGFIETLRGPARNDEKARDNFLKIMQTQTARMARLIDDLLSLSRIEMKPHSRPRDPIDLSALVAGVVETMGHLASEYDVEILYHRPDGPMSVPGDRDEIIQIFSNLLENACKYGQEGKRVEISIENGNKGPVPETIVSFRDYGPGIAEEHIPRITERFYRVDVEKSRVKNGTGLGLAIVKHILTRHDGRLTVRSALGKGSTFSVHLPKS
jgi:two-component system phosphate regulon sensor histidine kinase PhoR